MITEQAARALVLASAIETARPDDASFWHSVVNRIIWDLDEAGNGEGVKTVKDILAEQWNMLPGSPGKQ